MKYYFFLVIVVILLFAKNTDAQETITICAPTPNPNGPYILTSSSWTSACPQNANFIIDGIQTGDNQATYTNYAGVAVGGQLQVCAIDVDYQGNPAGWQVVTSGLPGACVGLPGGNDVIEHVTCTSGDTNCFPGTLTASPNPVVVPYDQTGSTTISWYTPGVDIESCVWVSVNGAPQTLAACGIQVGNYAPNYIQAGNTYTFSLYLGSTTGTLLTKPVTVRGVSAGVPSLSSASNPVIVPYGHTSTSFGFTWNAPGYSQVTAYVKTGGTSPSQIVCIGNGAGSGTGNASISGGEIETFYLTPYQNCTPFAGVLSAVPSPVLATLTVTGKQGAIPTLTTPQNPIVIPAGQASAGFGFTWSAPGYSQVTAYVKTGGTSPSQIVCIGNGAGSGTGNASISGGEIETFYLTPYQNCTPFAGVLSAVPSPVLATLTVTGKQGAIPTLTTPQNPIVIPAGQTSAHFGFTWSAPGYSQVTAYVVTGGTSPNQIICIGSGAGSGNGTGDISIGEIQTFYLTPYQNCAPGSVVTAVPYPQLAVLKVTTTN